MQVEIQVGGEVGYYRSHGMSGTILAHGFSRIAKVNHHGHIILEDGRQFDRRGDERKTSYGGLRLVEATRLREMLAQREQRQQRSRTANELKGLIDGQRNGHGEQCPASDELKERMIELVRQL